MKKQTNKTIKNFILNINWWLPPHQPLANRAEGNQIADGIPILVSVNNSKEEIKIRSSNFESQILARW